MYRLPELTYAYDALEPVVDARTMELHHSVHHAGYVAGANRTLEALAAARSSAAFGDILTLERNLAFHVSGHLLHSRFWQSMTPGSSSPDAQLQSAVERDFGTMDALRGQMTAAATGVQGSGWAALGVEPTSGQLLVTAIQDHQGTTVTGLVPILVIDVWEHAYYLKHQSRRGEWITAFWEVVDWASASTAYGAIRSTDRVHASE